TTAYVTGTFDPITDGHLFLIRESLKLFGNAVVLVLINPEKICKFSLENRLRFIGAATDGMENVMVAKYRGLAVDYINMNGGGVIVRGVRNEEDFEYEEKMARWNEENGGVETFILYAPDELKGLSSTAVREGLSRGDYAGLPEPVASDIRDCK
ncbi:MAG: pantetheine-phosphate adenylyltransferase, partial [Clostridiales bacterium]|nr:pantetheine-phosphate adenylyltransferase [Clostridiales bacterium]